MRRNLLGLFLLAFACAGLQASPVTLGYLEYAPEFDMNHAPISFGFNLALLDTSIDLSFGYAAPPLSNTPLRFNGLQLVVEVEDTNLSTNVKTVGSFTYTDNTVRTSSNVYQLPLSANDKWLEATVAGQIYSRSITRTTLTASLLPGVPWQIYNGAQYVYFIPDNSNYNLTQAVTYTYSPQSFNLDFSGGSQFPLLVSGTEFVPESSSLAFTGMGLALLGFARRRKVSLELGG